MENLGVNNILIVESQNDKFFIEALLEYMELSIKIDEPICNIDEFECLNGMNNLEFKLNSLKTKIVKKGIEKVGIILDSDNDGIKKREQFIIQTIQNVFGEFDENLFKIYVMNVDGYGELENVLKYIAKNSVYADCLEEWNKCLGKNKLNQKQFIKLWIQFYQRYDCCSKKEQKQADKKCNNEISLKKIDCWDFDNENLDELKQFLIELGK